MNEQRPLFHMTEHPGGVRYTPFDGKTVDQARDHPRLSRQLATIWDLMRDGNWRTLSAIEYTTRAPQASVSARLRDLRKEKFGGHRVERRQYRTPAGAPVPGLYEYRVTDRITRRATP